MIVLDLRPEDTAHLVLALRAYELELAKVGERLPTELAELVDTYERSPR